jgi:hypothetical protein
MTAIPSLLPAFDPRQVPVTGVDADLPAVPPERLTPGPAPALAPPRWQPEVRQAAVDRAPAEAAVLVPLVARAAGLSVLLTERDMGLPTHAGRWRFRAARSSAGDGDVVHAALREAREEVGLAPGFIECWASCRSTPRAAVWSRRWWRC